MFYFYSNAQHEYLYEDIEQIRRFFPGAEFVEALETPFDLTTSRAQSAKSSQRSSSKFNFTVRLAKARA